MMNDKKYFPMFVDLSDKKVIVIGAGTIAARRIRTLLSFTEDITVVAPHIHPDIKLLEEQRKIKVECREYEREDLYDAYLAIAATDNKKLNDEIYSVSKCLGILVNVVSDRNKCDFYFPGVVLQEEVVIGINAGGMNHKKAKEIRLDIEEYFSKKEQA